MTAAAQNIISPKAPLPGPSLLANLKPVPDLNLALPDDIAAVVARRGINGETGLIPTSASITTFRLRATGDLVSVAAPTTVLRWTEIDVTYEISSRTLDAVRLAEVANKLR